MNDVLKELAAVDRELARAVPVPLTLDPERARSTALAELGSRLITEGDDPALCRAFASALACIARSQLEHFPENLFWDLDYLGASMLAGARAAADPVRHVAQVGELGAALSARFGARSPIRFRYVHDFLYGFDWQRWVAADPDARAGVGPFDLPFLHRMLDRGDALAARVASHDPEFPPLDDPRAWRNPFSFSRDPAHELALHRELSSRGELPVHAWRVDAVPDWRRPYTRMRAELARTLALPEPPARTA